MNPSFNHSRDIASFILKIGVNHIILNILKVKVSFLNNEKLFGLDLPKKIPNFYEFIHSMR